jgi:HAD superfamily hydrolase (TIGR01549 family)
MDPESFQRALLDSSQAMASNAGGVLTNREVFWSRFNQLSGIDQSTLEPFFDQFYRNEFDLLSGETTVVPHAADLIRCCLERNLDVVIATNPVFPRSAIEKRLDWAGLPVSEYRFDLVTSYENMHATKPSQAYYTEILQLIGRDANESLMVGDSWINDIEPAAAIGMHTYWIRETGLLPPERALLSGFGSLAELYSAICHSEPSTMRLPGTT